MTVTESNIAEIIKSHIEYYKTEYNKSKNEKRKHLIMAKIEALADFGMQYRINVKDKTNEHKRGL